MPDIAHIMDRLSLYCSTRRGICVDMKFIVRAPTVVVSVLHKLHQ